MKTNELLKTALENLPKSKGWKPEEGEVYWVITVIGEAENIYWDAGDSDNNLLKQGNCFRTKSDAEKASKIICEVNKLIREELYN